MVIFACAELNGATAVAVHLRKFHVEASATTPVLDLVPRCAMCQPIQFDTPILRPASTAGHVSVAPWTKVGAACGPVVACARGIWRWVRRWAAIARSTRITSPLLSRGAFLLELDLKGVVADLGAVHAVQSIGRLLRPGVLQKPESLANVDLLEGAEGSELLTDFLRANFMGQAAEPKRPVVFVACAKSLSARTARATAATTLARRRAAARATGSAPAVALGRTAAVPVRGRARGARPPTRSAPRRFRNLVIWAATVRAVRPTPSRRRPAARRGGRAVPLISRATATGALLDVQLVRRVAQGLPPKVDVHSIVPLVVRLIADSVSPIAVIHNGALDFLAVGTEHRYMERVTATANGFVLGCATYNGEGEWAARAGVMATVDASASRDTALGGSQMKERCARGSFSIVAPGTGYDLMRTGHRRNILSVV